MGEWTGDRVERFFQEIKGKRIAFCGIGGSNLPLIEMFHKKGAYVLACDKKTKEELGEKAQSCLLYTSPSPRDCS